MAARSTRSGGDAANGAIVLVFGLFLFSIQDVIIKYFSGAYSVLQIVFVRGCVAILLLLLFVHLAHGRIPLRSKRPLLLWSRSLLGFLSYLFYYLAVAAMPLAEVVSITFTMPLFVTAMSALLLREQVGPRRWMAVAVGFIGVIIILSPSGAFNPLAVVFAFFAAITYASMTVMTRFLGGHDHPMTMAINAIVVFTLASGTLTLLLATGMLSIDSSHPSLAFLVRDWSMPSQVDGILMISLGFIAAIGFYCLSRAYVLAEASAIAPFEFTYILWAVIFGYLFWQEAPGPTTVIGVGILISSSLYIWYRERSLAKRHAADLKLRAERLSMQARESGG
ncbi:MAG: DMT family transporter [Gammaproteobacteria bacterium]|nr:DMT family transporter [Gammaproteobacteria bacterium]